MKFAPYTSGRLKELNIGITSYSEGRTSLNIVGNVGIGTKDPYATVGVGNTSVLAVGILTANRIYSTVFGEFTGGSVVADNIVGSALSISGITTIGGNVGIGTDDPTAVVGTSNTAILAVGILTANRIYSTVFGEFTGGTVTADNIVGSALSVSGISTLGTVQVSSGIITATSGVVTYFGDGSNLIGVAATENVTTNNLKVLGISTFKNSVGINSDLQVTGVSTFTGLAKFSGNFEAAGNVTLGDGTGDNIDVQGRFVRELVPSSNGNKDLGTSSFRWGTLHIQNILQSGGGISTIQQLNVIGVSTFVGIATFQNVDINQGTIDGTHIGFNQRANAQFHNVDVDTTLGVTGQTTLGNVNVTGVSTLGITSATNLEAQQLNVTGVSTFSDNLNLPDNKKIQLGDSSDLQLYHSVSGSGSTSYIDNNTGPLYIRNNVDDDDGGNIIIEAKAGKASAVFQDDEGVRLYYNDAEKIATTGYGVTVNGTTQTQQLNVSGISTLGNTVVGGATTQLLVTGDARVTGEFKVGDGTIILNDAGVSTFPKTVNIGPVSISTVTATTFPFDVQVGGSGDIKLFGGTGIVSATAFYGSGIGLTDISIPGINTSATSNFTNFSVTGVSTLGTVQVSSGIITATSGVVTYFGDGSNLTGTGVGATDSVNTTGIVTASAFSGHGYLQAPYGSTVNFNVTVASKSGHRYQGQGSGLAYVINGVQSPVLTLTPGRTYRFTLSSSDMGSHPFRFYYEADRTTAYTTNVTTTATYAEITVTDTTPNVLHYQCLYHGYMGNSVVTNSNVVDTPYVATLRKGLNVTSGVSTFAGNINANGNIVGDSATNISGINNVSASTLTGTLQTAAQSNITSLGTLTGLDVNGHSELDNLNVSGVSTFAGNINANGNIIGDSATNISGINSVTATSFFGNGQGLTNITADTVGDLASLKVTGLSTFVGNAQFDGNVSIGGTLTYEDVTNVDSIGVITARSGIVVGAGISAVGVITATSFSGDGQDLDKVSIGSTDGNFIGKGYLQAQKTVNAGGDRGDANIILGRFAGCCHDGSSYNVYLGDQAGRKSSSSDTNRNVFIGCQAGCGNTTGYHNVFLGSETGKGICGDSGSMNLFAGLKAGMRNTGCYNIAFGKESYGRETGTKNISIGYMAANDVGAGGTSNVFIGDCAGLNAQVNGPPFRGGMSNVYLGTAAGYQNPGDFNIGIGDKSLNGNASVTAGCRNIALGQCSGNDIQSGVDNIMLGSCAGAKITTGSCNILLGYNSGCNATGSFRNVYVGTNIGKTVCGGAYDISLGSSNLCEAKWACNNIAIGKNIFQKANCQGPSADALFNIGIGDAVGTGLTTGGYNLMLGYLTGYCLTCACDNIIFGKKAGWKASESTKNIFIGCYAGRSSVSAGCAGQSNIAIGNLAGSQTSSTSDRNIFIGNRAGVEATGGCFNIALGSDAGSYVTGDRNIFLGQYSGFTQNVSGDKNVVIGDAVCLLSATGSTQLVIGAGATHWIDGDSSFNVTLAGIATAYSATGIVSATKFCGDGSCLTGLPGFSPDEQENLYAGTGAGTDSDADTCFNVAIGYSAGHTNCAGDYNVLLGYEAGNKLTTGACNVFIGKEAGKYMTTGSKNTFVGCAAGKNSQTGNQNVFIGWGAASSAYITGSNNFISGYVTANNASSASNNQIIGSYAGHCLTTGDCNIFIGLHAGEKLTTTNQNVFLGSYAGQCNTGVGNIAIGCDSLRCSSGGSGTIAIGPKAGLSNSGAYNIFLGFCAANTNTSGTYNIALGYDVELPSATGSCQLAIGQNTNRWITGDSSFNVTLAGIATVTASTGVVEATKFCGDGSCLTGISAGFNADADLNLFASNTCSGCNLDGSSGCFNLFLGACAGKNVTSGASNVFLGDYAGSCMCNGSDNISIGSQALLGSGTVSNNSGAVNTAIGKEAGKNITTGGCNIIVGCKAAFGITTGANNTIFGKAAGRCLTATNYNALFGVSAGIRMRGAYNTAFGAKAMEGSSTASNNTGGCNIAIGKGSGEGLTTGGNNIFMGKCAGKDTTIGSFNFFGGYKAAEGNIGGACNVYIGNQVGYASTGGEQNIALGQKSAYNNSTGSYNISFGTCASYSLTSGSRNIVLGKFAMDCAAVTGNNNIALGASSSKCMTSGSHNIALGTGSLQCCMSTGLCNIAIGIYAGRKLQNDCNIAIGACALFGSGGGIGYCNIAIGLRAGQKLTNGHDNIFMGTCAGLHITGSGSADGSYNIGFGREALGGLADGGSTTGNFNAVMGFYSGRKISSGSNNVLMGRNTGCSITSGGCNTFLGLGSGKCVSTGSKNIAIGVNVTPPSDTGSCQIVIGVESSYWMVGNSDFNVGIGTTNPNAAVGVGNTAKLSVGIVSAYQLYGDGSNLTGLPAGGFNADSECNLFSNNTCSGCNFDGTADNNILLGACAGKSITSSCYNVIMGSCAGATLTGGRRNILIGQCSGYGLTSAVRNIIIGCSGKTLTTGPSNVWIGMGIGDGGTAGNTNDSVVIGHYAGHNIQNGHYNLFLGAQAGYNNTSGCRNIFIGHRSVYCNTTGHFNIALGTCMELPIKSGDHQLAIGCVDKYWITGNANWNVGIGTTNPELPVGAGNTAKLAVGIVSAYQLYGDGSNLTGLPGFTQDSNCNLIAGFSAGTCAGASPSTFNIIIGCGTGCFNGNGEHNVVMGTHSGRCAVGATRNVLIGMCAGSAVNNGKCNVYLGNYAGAKQYCSDNIAIGCEALCGSSTASNNTGEHNIALGKNAGANVTSGGCNVFIGSCAGKILTSGVCNIFLGRAGTNVTTGNFNIAIGNDTGGSATTSTGEYNISFGDYAGCCLTSGLANISIGYNAGQKIKSGNGNIFMGRYTGCGSQDSDYNIAIGQRAGKCLTSGGCNIFLGLCAGLNASSGCKNILLGCNTGKCITTGYCNVFIGNYAGVGDAAITGYRNTVVGDCAGVGIEGGYLNAIFGHAAGNSIENDIGNTLIGACSGRDIRYNDNYNTFIGFRAGRLQQGGCGNVIIGACIDRVPFYCDTGGSANEGCQLVIGYESNVWLSGNKDWNVGIGTTNTKTELQVGSHYGVSSGMGTFTAAAGVAHTINQYTISSTDFKTAEYTIFAGIGSDIQSQKLLVMQDGTTAYSQEYAVMSSDTLLVSASATLTSGVVKVEITPETGVSGLTTFRFTRHTML